MFWYSIFHRYQLFAVFFVKNQFYKGKKLAQNRNRSSEKQKNHFQKSENSDFSFSMRNDRLLCLKKQAWHNWFIAWLKHTFSAHSCAKKVIQENPKFWNILFAVFFVLKINCPAKFILYHLDSRIIQHFHFKNTKIANTFILPHSCHP